MTLHAAPGATPDGSPGIPHLEQNVTGHASDAASTRRSGRAKS